MIRQPLKPVRSSGELESEVRRIAGDLLADALGDVRSAASIGHEKAVHETRKRIKEVRALLRLIEKNLVDADGGRVRRRDNDQLRSAAGALSGSRDSAVVVATLDAIVAWAADELEGLDLAPLRDELLRRRDETASGGVDHLDAAAERLEGVLGRSAAWQVKADDAWEVIESGLKRIYRRGRRAMRAAFATTDPVPWHDWRRRAKDLRYALELLREAAPELLGSAASTAKAVTDHLGDDHDLAVLRQTLQEAALDDGARERLCSAIERRRGEVQDKARRLGAMLYAEKPSPFVRRVRAYWMASS